MDSPSKLNRSGLWAAFFAFFSWGLFPIYWKWLKNINVLEVIGHRMFWSFVMLHFYLWYKNEFKEVKLLLKSKHSRTRLITTSILIFFNWSLFIWAVRAGFVIECSLGYFMTPLMNIFLGVIFLDEKLKNYQWFAVLILFLSIVYLAIFQASNIFIPLGLAISFGLYGLIRKKLKVDSIKALYIESGLMSFLYLFIFGYLFWHSEINFIVKASLVEDFLLVNAGLVTLIPLVLFGFAVNLLPLSILGIFQYIAPTLQLLSGIFIFNEAFSNIMQTTFVLIWLALFIFTFGGKITSRWKKLV